ncbi:glycosyl transferase family 1 [Bacteroidia bacterium]|nr:glycosyl transferase family 1 [Bacteroidia bacterium]
MRIAVNTRLLLKNKLEGIGWFSYQTLKYMTREHLKDEFIFFFDRPYSSEFVFAPNVTPIVLIPPARHPLLWYMFFEWSVRNALQKYHADVFLSPDGFVCLRSLTPTVNVIHDIAFEHQPEYIERASQRRFLLRNSKRYALRAEHIVTVSEYSKNDIAQTYCIAPDQISVVYNAANEHYFPLTEIEKYAVRNIYTEGQPYFIYIGSLHKRKNIKNMLIAFDKFKKQANENNIKFLIVGSAMWNNDEVHKVLHTLQFRDDVLFVPRLEPMDLNKALAASIALLYVSHYEGFGIPIVEAFAAETAVITSTTSSMPEIAGDAALLCHPDSPDDICNAMIALMETPNLRTTLIEKGRLQRTRFNWEQSADKLWHIIERVYLDAKKV